MNFADLLNFLEAMSALLSAKAPSEINLLAFLSFSSSSSSSSSSCITALIIKSGAIPFKNYENAMWLWTLFIFFSDFRLMTTFPNEFSSYEMQRLFCAPGILEMKIVKVKVLLKDKPLRCFITC
jgi:hypothetical protein